MKNEKLRILFLVPRNYFKKVTAFSYYIYIDKFLYKKLSGRN